MELKNTYTHARRACIQKWDWSRRWREEKKDRKLLNDNEIHHICVGTRHKETLKMLNNTWEGQKGEEVQWRGLDWLKHNTFTDQIPRQKSHWMMNRHLNNEGQELSH
jgi:hypothetical protein